MARAARDRLTPRSSSPGHTASTRRLATPTSMVRTAASPSIRSVRGGTSGTTRTTTRTWTTCIITGPTGEAHGDVITCRRTGDKAMNKVHYGPWESCYYCRTCRQPQRFYPGMGVCPQCGDKADIMGWVHSTRRQLTAILPWWNFWSTPATTWEYKN